MDLLTGDSGWAVKTEKGWQAYHEVCWLAERKEEFDGDAGVVGGDVGDDDDGVVVVDGDDNQFL